MKKEPIKNLINGVFPMFEIIQIVGNTNAFALWLNTEHKENIENLDIFHGYKFFFECAFSSVLESLYFDEGLKMKNNMLLNASIRSTISLEKLPNSCLKTIFLKNIYYHFKSIRTANNIGELVIALNNFHKHVISPFDNFYENFIIQRKHPKLSKEEIFKFHLIEKLYIRFSQLNNSGPLSYVGTLMKQYWPPENKLKTCFKGYKLAVQYTWNKLLGDKTYRNSCLSEIHNTKTWYGLIYNEENTDEDDLIKLLNRTFDSSKQTSFDAFFYRIRNEFIWPLEKKKKISITNMDYYFRSNLKNYYPKMFQKLLNKSIVREESKSIEETLDMMHYWYPISLIGTGRENNTGAFTIMLHGASELLKEKHKELEKIHICKFIHSREDNVDGNDYSYGILVDTIAAVGHYSGEWFLYYDCCGDYSGASEHEKRRVDDLIRKFQKRGVLELQEYEITHPKFREYVSKYISENTSTNTKITANEIKNQMNEIATGNRENNLIKDSQGLLLELVSYYLASNKNQYERFKEKKWSKNTTAGEIDILMQNELEVHIIECKLNPHTLNFDSEIQKINNKLNSFTKKKHKTFEFWFWYEPNELAKKSLESKNAKYFSLQTISNQIPSHLKTVFNHQFQ